MEEGVSLHHSVIYNQATGLDYGNEGGMKDFNIISA